ncbi:MAG: nickel pincer cofactor biosynthesis protein LarC [Acidobacteria bacterium]|nr:nickel pincer cofactor biosynthesis protein LarC [Acidobacteriota bacterium]
MRIAYLDCFAGISGDMFIGSLLDSGADQRVLEDAVAALNIGASLKIERVERSGISATKVHVLEDGKIVDKAPAAKSTQPQHSRHTIHSHKHTETHSYRHESHGRPLSAIRDLIQATHLAGPVKHTAIHAFELLGASEAKIHNVEIEDVHFHEVGAVDAIVDIVAASAGIHSLKIHQWYCSPLNVGGGTVDCSHGRFPVPAPATADLLRGLPTYSAHVQQELVTPTGAAIVRALSPTFGAQPAMRIERIGYGAGSRNPKDFPNVLRLSIGDADNETQSSVAVLETAIDDLSPQILAHVAEKALSLGALDVMSTAVQMKKGRLGTLITILADDARVAVLEDLLLRETSTLGVRIHHERRSILDRKHVVVNTTYGDIRIKIGSRTGEIFNAAPEFDDCRVVAEQHGVPVKQVQQAAMAAYLAGEKGNA